MSTDSWIQITVAFLALGILGLAAVVEASLATVNRVTLRALIEERVAAPRVQSLIDRPQSLRSSMLLIELISTVAAAAMLTSVFQREMGATGALLGLFLAGMAVILVGRVLPGAIIAAESAAAPRNFDRIASILALLAAPLILVIDRMIGLIAPLFRTHENGGDHHSDEVDANGRHENGNAEAEEFEDGEQEMISGVLHLDESTVREIMVPRPDIVAVSVDMPSLEVVDIIRRAGHSRIPVYQGEIDSIIGVVYAKDFLRFVHESQESIQISELIRPAYYVPESKRVDELLADLRREKVHLAIVVDEYGGTAGLVTIEDILEEIVGEIQDEYDQEMPLLERVGPVEIIVDGRVGVDEVGDVFETSISDGDFETIGGFVQKMLGRIPQEGESLRADSLLIEVQSVERRRIRKLRVLKIDEQADVPSDSAADAR